MPISSTSNQPPLAFLPDKSSAPGGKGTLPRAGVASISAKASSDPQSTDSAEEERITLTAAWESKGKALALVPVYAEIWKNGTRIAEIDVHGGVNPVNGLVAAQHGAIGGNGALLAARRAAELARSVSGEIRVGGQIIDSQTLDIRAKLRMAYGA